jgi:hypothetical protein
LTISRIRRLIALGVDDWSVVIRSSFFVPIASFRLHRFGLPSALRWVDAVDRPSGTLSHDQMAHVGRLVNIAARYGPARAACLTRSLVLLRVLRQLGMTAELRIGVRGLRDRELDAHAWVEYNGRPLNDRDTIAEDFATFPPVSAAIVIFLR